MSRTNSIFKGQRILKIASFFLVSIYLISCGGGGSSGSNVVTDPTISGTAVAQAPEFDLNGFVQCGKQEDTVDLKVKTHLAFGLKDRNKLVYLFNQIGKVKFNADTFGNDPEPSLYKIGYCKEVKQDNLDALVFSAALAAIKSHLNSAPVLTPAQLQEQTSRIAQTMYTVVDNKDNLIEAFAIVALYESKQGGAFFINARTKGGFPNDSGVTDGYELDRAVLAIEQSVHDMAFTPDALAKYRDVLVGRKFNSSDWFPGKVKAAADPSKVYTAKINASMAKDQGVRTAYSQYVARRPTGYYLAAGDIATVTVPKSMVNTGFVIRVGAHVHDKYVKSRIERPFRVNNKFPIVSEITEIANPFGGGIYIDTPYLATAGIVNVQIKNAVPAPFFSTMALNNTTLQQWKDTQRNNPAPWADFESDKFMMQVPTSWIYNYDDPVALMGDWDKRMDAVSQLLGQPLVRNNQILYLIVDTNLNSGAYGIGYPTGNNTYSPGAATDGNKKEWFLTPGTNFSAVEFHELGHAQLFSNFPGEGESAVNLLAVAVLNKTYGVDLDTALSKSFNSGASSGATIDRDQAALNWMVTPNFKAGKPMDISHTTKDEVQYQHRGHAKYVDIAALFGWGALESFYKEENRVADLNPQPASDGLSAVDSRIFRLSKSAGVDLTPLIHFWGVQPVDYAKLKTAIAGANLKPSALIYDRLLRYQSIIPMDNATFKVHAAAFLNKPVDKITAGPSPDYGEGWYYVWLPKYAPADGQAAQLAITNIVKQYFPNGRPI
jgi:Peptidase M60, enhancin and enhancin-like/N-terminal domain of M60-like peptidases